MTNSGSIFDLRPPAEYHTNPDGSHTFAVSTMTLDSDCIKVPMDFPPYPPAYLAPLGAIIVQWGAFEANHKIMLDALVKFNGTDPKEIGRGFERRRKLFKAEARKAFENNANLIEYAIKICADAKALYPSRNHLAHGQLHLKVEFGEAKPNQTINDFQFTIIAQLDESEMEFSMVKLRTIFYDLAHLSGRVAMFWRDNPPIVGGSSAERQFLRDFQDKVLPRHPTSNTHQGPPAPSAR